MSGSFAAWLATHGVAECLPDYCDLDRLLSVKTASADSAVPASPAVARLKDKERRLFGGRPSAVRLACTSEAARISAAIGSRSRELAHQAAELGRRCAALHAEAARRGAAAERAGEEVGDAGAMASRAVPLERVALSVRDRTENLDLFARQNVALVCAAARCGGVEDEVRGEVSRVILSALQLDGVIVALSDAYAWLREVADGSAGRGGPEKWVPPGSFERRTTKYWVRLDRVTALKMFIVERLPVLIFDRAAENAMSTPQVRRQADSGDISSVYFDSDDLDCYATRQIRLEGATLIRLRWYGNYNPQSGVFVERKTHHESWVKADSVKERFRLGPDANVFRFVNDGLDVDDDTLRASKNPEKVLDYSRELAGQVRDEIAARALSAKVRTTYRRTAFQLATSNQVRISLDTELCMVRDAPDNAIGRWCRDLERDPPGPDDIIRFPYAVLEVKLQDEGPEWVDDMLAECEAVPVHKFSKFLHGMASMYGERVPAFPHWFNNVDDESFTAQWELDIATIVDDSGVAADADSYDDDSVAGSSRRRGSRRDRDRKSKSKSKSNGGGGGGGGSSSRDAGDPPGLRLRAPGAEAAAAQPPPAANKPMVADAKRKKALELRKVLAKPVKIEPKTFFAIERTLLQWLNTLILLSVAALSALVIASDRDSKFALGAGISLAATSVVFGFYALYNYFRRINALTHGTAIRYDDRYGPPALIMILSMAMVVSMVLSLNDGSETL